MCCALLSGGVDEMLFECFANVVDANQPHFDQCLIFSEILIIDYTIPIRGVPTRGTRENNI